MMMGLPKKDKMPSKMMDDMESDEDYHLKKDGINLGIEKILDALHEISNDEVKPFIEELKSKHYKNPMEKDLKNMDGESEFISKGPKSSIEIEMGSSDLPETIEEDEEEGKTPRGGILEMLSKKMKRK